VGSFRIAPSFTDALGNSLTYSGAAAQQDENLPGRGLYVPMQRGLGMRGKGAEDKANARKEQERRRRGAQSEQERREPSPTNTRGLQKQGGASFIIGTGGGGSFVVNSEGRGGSFIMNHEGGSFIVNLDGGSFYSMGSKDARLEAMNMAGKQSQAQKAGAQPLQGPYPLIRTGSSMQRPSFYLAATPQHQNAQASAKARPGQGGADRNSHGEEQQRQKPQGQPTMPAKLGSDH